MMAETVAAEAIQGAMKRVAAALEANRERLTELDQALGDGDLGITAGKIAKALRDYLQAPAGDDLGIYLISAGMAMNRAASSTLGTLLATALMRAGKEVKGERELSPVQLAAALQAADRGMQERGKAKPGDKTIIDALHPASEAFAAALREGGSLQGAGQRMLAAAQEGAEQAKSLKSRIGRAGWVGETEGKADPGCEACLIILSALVEG